MSGIIIPNPASVRRALGGRAAERLGVGRAPGGAPVGACKAAWRGEAGVAGRGGVWLRAAPHRRIDPTAVILLRTARLTALLPLALAAPHRAATPRTLSRAAPRRETVSPSINSPFTLQQQRRLLRGATHRFCREAQLFVWRRGAFHTTRRTDPRASIGEVGQRLHEAFADPRLGRVGRSSGKSNKRPKVFQGGRGYYYLVERRAAAAPVLRLMNVSLRRPAPPNPTPPRLRQRGRHCAPKESAVR